MIDKSEQEFAIRKDTKRRRTECKRCRQKEGNEWAKAHRHLNRKASRVYYRKHKKVEIQRCRAYNMANAEKVLDWHLRRTFGISAEQYRELEAEQQGLCVCCGKPETAIDKRTGRARRLHVDHDHATGEIRGLLCSRCNLAIGCMKDDYTTAEAIAAYLKVFAK